MKFLYNVDILSMLTALTYHYLCFYFVLSAFKDDISILRLSNSSRIIAFYQLIRIKLNNPTILLDAIIVVIAILILKKNYNLIDFVKTIALYGLILIVSKAFEMLIVDIIDPNKTLLSMIVCLSILVSSFVLKLMIYLITNTKNRKLVYSVQLIGELCSIKTRAFWDSGNLLYHKGVPVIMISSRLAKKLKLKDSLKIPVSTVSGSTMLSGGKITLRIFSDKKSHKLWEVRYCISDTIVARGYEVLLHKEMEVV